MGDARWTKIRAGLLSVVALLACLGMVACTAVRPPAPYLPSRASITPGPTVTVRDNQNVYAIARANGVAMRDIIVLNDLRAPFTLKAGQKLVLPANAKPSSGPVDNGQGQGDYASSVVATSSKMPPTALEASVAATAVEQADLPPLPPQKPMASPLTNGTQASQATAAAPENILRPPHVANDQSLAKAAPEPAPPASIPAEQPAQSNGTSGVFAPTPVVETPGPANSNDEENQTTMIWPVQGPLLSSFGPKGQGLSNDGLNISAPKGAPVVAAASGIVVYAGNEIKGFGNLVLIRHQGGLVTAYAHLDRAMVNKDTVVAQGDMIGTVGKTGNVPSPQLHFEVRSRGKPVNPEGYIKGNPPEKATQG
ncbi:MAG: LysM peptidoglycan-binding domain-containing M23 family metallopeptidase [Bdellovibrionales bacterium]